MSPLSRAALIAVMGLLLFHTVFHFYYIAVDLLNYMQHVRQLVGKCSRHVSRHHDPRAIQASMQSTQSVLLAVGSLVGATSAISELLEIRLPRILSRTADSSYALAALTTGDLIYEALITNLKRFSGTPDRAVSAS